MGYDIEHAIFRINIRNQSQVYDICKYFHCDDSQDIIQAISSLRYQARLVGDYIIVDDIMHQFKWHGNEVHFWDMLAPYVLDGFIVWFGEDGTVWRYIFLNGVMSVMSEDAYVSQRTYQILPILKTHASNLPVPVRDFIRDIHYETG